MTTDYINFIHRAIYDENFLYALLNNWQMKSDDFK